MTFVRIGPRLFDGEKKDEPCWGEITEEWDSDGHEDYSYLLCEGHRDMMVHIDSYRAKPGT